MTKRTYRNWVRHPPKHSETSNDLISPSACRKSAKSSEVPPLWDTSQTTSQKSKKFYSMRKILRKSLPRLKKASKRSHFEFQKEIHLSQIEVHLQERSKKINKRNTFSFLFKDRRTRLCSRSNKLRKSHKEYPLSTRYLSWKCHGAYLWLDKKSRAK